MPTRVKSIWQRFPEPIPPPVVCRTEPIPLVNGMGQIGVRLIGTQEILPAGEGIISTVGITVKSLPGLVGSVISCDSDFWSAEPGEPLPNSPSTPPGGTMLLAPITTRTMTVNHESIVQWLETNYDAVVVLKFWQGSKILYNLYIDLGRLARNEDWNSG